MSGSVLLAVAGLSAVRLIFQLYGYIGGTAGVQRHHLETSSFILAAVLLASAGLNLRGAPLPAFVTGRGRSRLLIASTILVASAWALYWPILHVGLFSDDFVLLPHARSGDWLVEEWTFIRPLPLALWWVVSAIGAADANVSLHLLNATLHGVNAVLVAAVAGPLGIAWPAGLIGAAMFLTFPASVEPVVWASGIFDVSMTTALLAAVLVAVRGDGARSVLGVVACVSAALMCKETAIVAPALIRIAIAIARGPRAAITELAPWAAMATVVLYLAARFTLHPQPIDYPPLTGYAAKELLSRPIGALAMPFSSEFLGPHPVLATLAVIMAPMMLFGHALTWTAAGFSSLPALGSSAGSSPLSRRCSRCCTSAPSSKRLDTSISPAPAGR